MYLIYYAPIHNAFLYFSNLCNNNFGLSFSGFWSALHARARRPALHLITSFQLRIFLASANVCWSACFFNAHVRLGRILKDLNPLHIYIYFLTSTTTPLLSSPQSSILPNNLTCLLILFIRCI